MTRPPRLVIVGGGAGGLELATRLGDRLGRRQRAEVVLVDKSPTHLWKPLLHEVAAGTMDLDDHALEYLAQARWHHFRFQLGELAGLDRQAKEVRLAPVVDADGTELIPARTLGYDFLVIAIGSRTNDFGTPGAADYAISLDDAQDAERFRRRLIRACLRANFQREPLSEEQLHVAIVGAGATGVELAAELHNSTRELVAYGFERIDPERDIRLALIEAAPRILPALPERLAKSAEKLLGDLGVRVLTGERVTEVTPKGVHTASGKFVPAELTVWAAGIKAPEVLARLDGLEVNRLNQLLVRQTLETTRDPNIFALGDCACCPWPGHEDCVPPRAQAAHQQASVLARTLERRLRGKPALPFRYRDFGSLVSLGEYSTVGSLMGALVGGALWVEGMFARLMYRSLYTMHLYALHGFVKTLFDTLARLILRRIEPRVKLH